MKNIIITIFSLSILVSCSVDSSIRNLEHNIFIKDSDRSAITGLSEPTVDFVLLKDGDEYKNIVDLSLSVVNDSYVIELDLITGSSYVFESFTIKSAGNTEYILDVDIQSNIDGFSISSDGVFSVSPKVYLKKVTGIIFDSLEYETLSVEITTDESSFLDPVNLTFKVSSNIPDAKFHIYKYTIYWVTGPELEQNEIFDMDTANIFDPLIEGDDDPWGSGKYKIVTTDSIGNSVFIVGFSDEWNKKHIHLILD